MSAHHSTSLTSWLFPVLALALFAATLAFDLGFAPTPAGMALAAVLLVVLFGTVFAAVHHAEVIADRVGEPYGTLVLTMAVTVIEVAVIATLMLGPVEAPTLARDTVFAVVMIVCNGLVGACILVGSFHHREQDVQIAGANVYLSVLAVMATITLVLPNYTLTAPGPLYSAGQLVFVSIVTLLLYGVFLYTQTVRHRDYFVDGAAPSGVAAVPNRVLWTSVGLLLAALLGVVLLAKKFSAVIDAVTVATGAPAAFTGIVVATLMLLPESVAAIAAARRNELQRSVNLALGSSLATIGLTIPAVSVAVIVLEKPLVLGLSQRDTVLLLVTALVSMMTVASGRTNILFGLVHLIVFAVFIFTVFVP